MRIPLLALTLVMSLTLAFSPLSAYAEGSTPPGSFADLAEKLLPAVVNISSTQKVEASIEMPEIQGMPQFPPGSPFEEFFEEFRTA